MKWIYPILGSRPVLILLLVINALGTVYGFIWYKYQLIDTPWYFRAFVPDSPTASLFFVFVLLAFLWGKNFSLFEALAMVTLIKYGIWAVVMNFMVLYVNGEIDWTGIMLILSHGAMALQAVLYSPFYRMKPWHLAASGIWTLHNDIIDYVFSMMPRYQMLEHYMAQIGYFTFWLSLFSIGAAYYFGLRKNRFSLSVRGNSLPQ